MADGSIPSLAAAHLRLGRAAVAIYSAASAVALTLLMASLFTEHSHTKDQLRKQVLVQAEERAHAGRGHAAAAHDVHAERDPLEATPAA